MTPGMADRIEILEAWLRLRGRRDLDPDRATVERVRSTVVSAFAERAASRAPVPRPVTAPVAACTAPRTGGGGQATIVDSAGRRARIGARVVPRRARPFVAAALAAALTAVSVGGPAWVFASESSPGHALYDVRVAVETIGLPGIGTADRAIAETARLERRIAEVREEWATRDWAGAEAALRATKDEASALERALAAAPSARATVRDRIREARHVLRVASADVAAPASVRSSAQRTEETLEHAGTSPARSHGARRPRP